MPSRTELKRALAIFALSAGALVAMYALRQTAPQSASEPRGDAALDLHKEKLLTAPHFSWIIGAAIVLVLSAVEWRIGQLSAQRTAAAIALTGGKPDNAPPLLIRFGCASCHQISGIAAAGGLVGPSLDGIRRRVYIGGSLTNTATNLENWIVNPRAVSPDSAMPVTGITPREARDVAAFLYSH